MNSNYLGNLQLVINKNSYRAPPQNKTHYHNTNWKGFQLLGIIVIIIEQSYEVCNNPYFDIAPLGSIVLLL